MKNTLAYTFLSNNNIQILFVDKCIKKKVLQGVLAPTFSPSTKGAEEGDPVSLRSGQSRTYRHTLPQNKKFYWINMNKYVWIRKDLHLSEPQSSQRIRTSCKQLMRPVEILITNNVSPIIKLLSNYTFKHFWKWLSEDPVNLVILTDSSPTCFTRG